MRCANPCACRLASALRDDWSWAWEAHKDRRLPPRPGVHRAACPGGMALAMLCLDAVHSGAADSAVWPGKAYERFKSAAT
jgi:aminopeptidase N